jgi:hypothetical protein
MSDWEDDTHPDAVQSLRSADGPVVVVDDASWTLLLGSAATTVSSRSNQEPSEAYAHKRERNCAND